MPQIKLWVFPLKLYTTLSFPLIWVVKFYLYYLYIFKNLGAVSYSLAFLSLNILTVILQYDLIISISEISAGLFLISVLLLSCAVSWYAGTYLYTTHYTISKLHTKADQQGIMECWLVLSLQWFLIFNL